MNRFGPFWRYAWASPATAIGLVLAAIARLSGAQAVVVDGVLEVSGGGVERTIAWLPRPCQFAAITFGHVVIGINPAILAECRVHEWVHVRQYERWGVLFFPLYIGSSLLQLAQGRNPYWCNHFERQAYREERRTAR